MINYSNISAGNNIIQKLATVESEIQKAIEEDGAVFLSDSLVMLTAGGAMVLEYLGKDHYEEDRGKQWDEQKKYIIKVLCDEWGNEPKENDIVELKYKKNVTDAKGVLLDSQQEKYAKMAGTYDKKFYKTSRLKVDKYGCVTATFEDAVRMLNLNGVHSVSGEPLTNKSRHSMEPVDAPDGSKKLVWYWRFKELTQAEYSALKPIDNNNTKGK